MATAAAGRAAQTVAESETQYVLLRCESDGERQTEFLPVSPRKRRAGRLPL